MNKKIVIAIVLKTNHYTGGIYSDRENGRWGINIQRVCQNCFLLNADINIGTIYVVDFLFIAANLKISALHHEGRIYKCQLINKNMFKCIKHLIIISKMVNHCDILLTSKISKYLRFYS